MKRAAALLAAVLAAAVTVWIVQDSGSGGGESAAVRASFDAGVSARRTDVAPEPEIQALSVPTGELSFPTTAQLRRHVDALAGDELRGRMAGTDGERGAAEYIAGELRRYGLDPIVEEFGYDHYDSAPWTQVSERRTSRNVMAWLEGTGPEAGDEYILIGAHYDHLGVDANGTVYCGADDNASGVAGLLGIAEAWAGSAQRPRKSLLLVAFGAEEQGLRGSRYLSTHPARPQSSISLMINLDMIGRSPFMDSASFALPKRLGGIADGPGVGLLSDDEHPELTAAARTACEAEALPMYAASDYPEVIEKVIRGEAELRGDHAPFMERGVPYLWFSTSMHDDYHLPGDTRDKIDIDVLRKVARAAYRVALATDPQLRNMPSR
jgi:hypothetical protein